MVHFETASSSAPGMERWVDDDGFLGPMRPLRRPPTPTPTPSGRGSRSWLWRVVNAAIEAHLEAEREVAPLFNGPRNKSGLPLCHAIDSRRDI